jgi:DNA-binding beta-propeller fold protein YncE
MGTVIRTFGSLGTKPGQFKIPNSLCVDSAGYVYVSDTLNFRVQKLTPNGDAVWAKGSPGRRLGQFGRPRGVRVGPDGVLFVVEGAMQLVQLFDGDGQTLMSFGGPGKGLAKNKFTSSRMPARWCSSIWGGHHVGRG